MQECPKSLESVYDIKLSPWSSSNFFRASRMFIFSAAVSAKPSARRPPCSSCPHTYSWIVHYDEDVRVLRQLVEDRGEFVQLHL